MKLYAPPLVLATWIALRLMVGLHGFTAATVALCALTVALVVAERERARRRRERP